MARQKIGYEFMPFPKRLHPLWKGQPMGALGICLKLFELNEGRDVKYYGDDWMAWLCLQMDIHGRDRPNVRKTLARLQELGLIGVSGDLVSFCFRDDDELRVSLSADRALTNTSPTPAQHQPIPSSCSDEHQPTSDSTFPLDLSVENDSGQKIQTDKTEETRQDESNAQARACTRETVAEVVQLSQAPEYIGFRWLNLALGGAAPDFGSWRSDYERIGVKPEAERSAVAQHMLASDYIVENRRKAKPDHLLKYWADFVDGPRNVKRPFAATQPPTRRGMAPVSTHEEFVEDARRMAAGEFTW